jgi:hypothetical protein
MAQNTSSHTSVTQEDKQILAAAQTQQESNIEYVNSALSTQTVHTRGMPLEYGQQ